MKKIFYLLLISNISLAQISFEKGYYINNNGDKVDGLIKNEDWKNNPIKFQYKASTNSKPEIKEIQNVQEFGIDSISKYVRFSVQLDKSSYNTNVLSTKRNPEFVERTVFLKTLVEGNASLYYYENPGLKKFFYSMHQSPPEPLIFKKYIFENTAIKENNAFINQLKTSLKCEEMNEKEFFGLNYRKKDLINLFTKYNRCSGGLTISFEKNRLERVLNLKYVPEFNLPKLRPPRTLLMIR